MSMEYRSKSMRSKVVISLVSFVALLAVVQTAGVASAAAATCKRAPFAPVNTSSQTLFPGQSLQVTFGGVGGGCGAGNFKVITSTSSDTNSQGYITGAVTNISLNTSPSGASNNYQTFTHTRQFSDSDIGKFFQYYFVTSAGFKSRSSLITVVPNN